MLVSEFNATHVVHLHT